MIEYDELKIYTGCSIPINQNIVIHQPTLSEIVEFGEKQYFNAVYTLTSSPADFKWQLWEIGIDYTKVDDYELFVFFTSHLLASQKNIYNEWIENPIKYQDELIKLTDEDAIKMKLNPLQLIIKNIDMADFTVLKETYGENNEQYVLYDLKNQIIIDRFVYRQIVDIVRKIHGLKRNSEIPANERTKMDLIEDARDEAMLAQNKPYKSLLKPLISTMKIKTHQCNNDQILKVNIEQFLYDIKKIGQIQNAELLLKGAYAGFNSLKGIEQNKLNIFADI